MKNPRMLVDQLSVGAIFVRFEPFLGNRIPIPWQIGAGRFQDRHNTL